MIAFKQKVSSASAWASSKVTALVAVASVSAYTMPVHAAAVDVADVVTDIGAQAVPIGLIGAAVLLIVVAVKAFQWVRRALS